jgi:hypothetical protein
LAAGAFGFGMRAPVLAEGLEAPELVVIEFGEIAGRTVVQELEDVAHGSLGVAVDARLSGVIGRRLVAASFGDHVAEPIDVPEHLVEIFRGALKLAAITLALKQLHRLLDRENLIEDLRDRLTQS